MAGLKDYRHVACQVQAQSVAAPLQSAALQTMCRVDATTKLLVASIAVVQWQRSNGSSYRPVVRLLEAHQAHHPSFQRVDFAQCKTFNDVLDALNLAGIIGQQSSHEIVVDIAACSADSDLEQLVLSCKPTVLIQVAHQDVETQAFNIYFYSEIFSEVDCASVISNSMQVIEMVSKYNCALLLDELPALTESECAWLRSIQASCDAAVETTLPQLVFDTAIRAPERIALDYLTDKFTYLDVCRIAIGISYGLRTVPVALEEAVGLTISEGPYMPLAELGIWLSGAAFCPIDLSLPAPTVQYMVTSVKLKVLVVQDLQQAALIQHVLPLFTGAVLTVQSLITLGSSLLPSAASDTMPSSQAQCDLLVSYASLEGPKVHPSSMCHVYFTSGSTGFPKGVVVEHRSLANFALQNAKVYNIDGNSRVLMASAFTFDPSVGDNFTALCTGATLCMVPRQQLMGDFGSALLDTKATHACSTPALWGLVAGGPDDYPDLRSVCIGGEAMPRDLISSWACSSTLRFYNTYGVTEAAVYQFSSLCSKASNPKYIGRPYASVQAYILTAAGQLAAPGTIGFLHLGGVQLARGYLGLDSARLSSQSFVTSRLPIGTNPCVLQSTRTYSTGDLARVLADGSFELIGRADNQIKIQGVRVDPEDIEVQLMLTGLLRRAVVIWHEQRLSAVCEVRDDDLVLVPRELLPDLRFALKQHCKVCLPVHMQPRDVLFLNHDDWPLTASGKIDRKTLAIRALGSQLASARPQHDTSALCTSTERFVQSIWSVVLGIPSSTIGKHADFFELGGDSLSALRVTRMIADKLSLLERKGADARIGLVKGDLAPQELMSRSELSTYAAFLDSTLQVPVVNQSGSNSETVNHTPLTDDRASAATADISQLTAVADTLSLAEASAQGNTDHEASVFVDASDSHTLRSDWQVAQYHKAMMNAASAGCVPLLRLLLDQRVDCDAGISRARPGMSPLHAACSRGHLAVVELLLLRGASSMVCTGQHVFPAHVAASSLTSGSVSILRALLAAGTPKLIRDENKQTLVHYAARAGNVDTLTFLLDQDCGLEERDRWHRTAVHWAVINNHPATLKLLLNRGASPNGSQVPLRAHKRRTTLKLETPIHSACRSTNIQAMLEILRGLLQAKVKVNAADEDGATAFDVILRHDFHSKQAEPPCPLAPAVQALVQAGAHSGHTAARNSEPLLVCSCLTALFGL